MFVVIFCRLDWKMNRLVAIVLAIVTVAALYYFYYVREASPKIPVEELSNYTGHPPGVWGPATWRIIHTVSINFPFDPTDSDREAYSMFIAGLAMVLPCGKCRFHFQEMLKGDMAIQPRDLVDRRSIFAWSVRLHNRVNEKLKKDYSTSIEHWFNFYTNLRNAA